MDKTTTFDAKVQRLFFNVDISSRSPSLVDKFTEVQELTYKKPGGYVVYPLMGSVWTHTFKFITHSCLTNPFDTGIIELKVTDDSKGKKILDIWWTLQFEKIEDAKNVFIEMKNYFSQTKAISKVYQSDLAIETAEFTDRTAHKYPYIMFMLFDNSNLEKKYKIIFSLDNEMHYEN